MLELTRLMLAGAALYAAVHELWVFRYRRRDSLHALMAALAVVTSGFLLARYWHLTADSAATTILAQRVEYTLGFAIVPIALSMSVRLASTRPGPTARSLWLASVLCVALPWCGQLAIRDEVATYRDAFGVHLDIARPGPLLGLVIPLWFVAGFTVLRWMRSTPVPSLADMRDRRIFAVTCVVSLVPAATNDLLFQLGVVGSTLTAEYGIMALLVALTWLMVRRTERSHHELEQAMAERTKQLETKRKQLILADRLAALGRLAAGVGHEINNPLGFVIGNLTFARSQLAEGPAGRAELDAALTDAEEGAHRITRIVDDLRLLGQPDRDDTGPIDLRGPLEQAVKLSRHKIAGRADLELHMQPVPPIQACPSRLGQVFVNLLLNALQALDGAPDRHHRIVVRTRTADGCAIVEISDTGIGIDAAVRDRVFEPFFTTKGTGSGLGLAISHEIVAGFGGHIELDAVEGGGTCARVRLPSIHGAVAAERIPAQPLQPSWAEAK